MRLHGDFDDWEMKCDKVAELYFLEWNDILEHLKELRNDIYSDLEARDVSCPLDTFGDLEEFFRKEYKPNA